MWAVEYERRTTAAPERIWRLWQDVDGWPAWNGDLERAELVGAFAPGASITMTSLDGDQVELRIAETREPLLFVDEAEFEGLTVRTTHRVDADGAGAARIVYRMEIHGDEADVVGPELGPQISGDFPDVLAALAELAESDAAAAA